MKTTFQKLNRAVGAATRLFLALALMTGLAAAADNASITLAWDANSESNLTGYNVYRSQSAGAFTSPLNPSLVSGTSMIDPTVQTGNTYYYVVKAVNSAGQESSASNQIPFTVPGVAVPPPVVPGVPTGLAAQCNPNGTFTVRWNAVAGADNYYLRIDYLANNVGSE